VYVRDREYIYRTHLWQDLGERSCFVHDAAVWVEHVTPHDAVAGDDGRRLGRGPAEAGGDVGTAYDERVAQVTRLVRNPSR